MITILSTKIDKPTNWTSAKKVIKNLKKSKKTSIEDNLIGRRPLWNTTSMEDKLNERQTQLKTNSIENKWRITSIENNLNERQPQ